MGTKHRLIVYAAWMVCVAAAACAEGGTVEGTEFRFFSDEDRARIRASAETDWGTAIVDRMRRAWDERQTHDMAVPDQEAGHFHHYFCPDHKCHLAFDWNEPKRHFCPVGRDYLSGERYDHAWVRHIHMQNQQLLRNSTWLHIVTGDAKYLEPSKALLLDYAAKYPAYEMHGHDMKPAPYGGKLFSQTLDEATWICDVAPAYAEVRPLLSDEEAERIEAGLLRPCADVIYGHRAGGNWQVWHNAGLASAAIALEDEKLLDIALNDPEHGYHHMMEVGVTDEGWWDERSPGYHFYPLEAMLRTAEAVRCRGINLYDERLRRMFTGPMQAVYPDLRFPAHNDGWYGTSLDGSAPLYELAALRFGDPTFDELLARCYAREDRSHPWALLHGGAIGPDPSPMPLKSSLFPDTGIAFLRNGTQTVVLKYGPHGGGHGHPDKLSISLHDGTRELVADMGTPGYGVPDYTAWYKRTVSHSTVVVDGVDQKQAAGTLLRFEPADDGGTAAAACDTAYDGVHMERSLALRGPALEDRFACVSGQPHAYDYVLILTQPVTPPDSAQPASLPAQSGYGRIENAVTWAPEGPVTLPIGDATLTLSAEGPFTLTTGTAPGIPNNPWNENAVFQPCYPLILRVEGTEMKVTAAWRFREE